MANNMDQYRKSPRAKWLEYNEGVYFLTICTLNHVHYFGTIVDGEMCLSAVGAFLQNELEHIEQHHPHVSVLQYVVMPNHFHALLRIHYMPSNREHHLGFLMSRFKGGTSFIYGKMRRTGGVEDIGEKLWQRDYWDDLVSSEEEFKVR